jgi:hypothetical protein
MIKELLQDSFKTSLTTKTLLLWSVVLAGMALTQLVVEPHDVALLIVVDALMVEVNTVAHLMTSTYQLDMVEFAESKSGQKSKLDITEDNNSTLSSKTNALTPTVGNSMILPVHTNVKTPIILSPSVLQEEEIHHHLHHHHMEETHHLHLHHHKEETTEFHGPKEAIGPGPLDVILREMI